MSLFHGLIRFDSLRSKQMGQTITNILLVRLDRLGDLILTLPVDQHLKEKGYAVRWWIPEGLRFVTEGAAPSRSAREIRKDFSFAQFRALWRELRRGPKPDVAVVFHGPWWLGLLFWLNRIPARIGRKSQWHSYLFFNRGVRQKRSKAEFHELEYNYQLIEEGLGFKSGSLPREHMRLIALQNEISVVRKFKLEPASFVVVHPGMAGSARNWPTKNYIDLIDLLVRRTLVTITGTRSDEAYLHEIRQIFGTHPRVIWLDGRLSGAELVAVLKSAQAVIAPSTGVIHVAASTGVLTVGLYSPVRVQAARRWGPCGDNVRALAPEIQCPGELQCLGSACSKFDCMPMITVQDVFEQVFPVLKN